MNENEADQGHIRYYDRLGKPMSTLEWAESFEDPDYKVVRQELVGGTLISTVWLGLDHSFEGDPEPLIFETMAFDKDNNPTDWDAERYPNEEKAIAGHERWVAHFQREMEYSDE